MGEQIGPADGTTGTPRWLKLALAAAGVYNLLWGAFAVLFPWALFDWMGMDRPNYPWLWQCIGMIVGVYGIGYLIASRDPRRHWPIVLVGLLGKIFGPMGFVISYAEGAVPLHFGATILTNDLLWWIPFALLLWDAASAVGDPGPASATLSVRDAMASKRIEGGTSVGRSLLELSDESPLLVVFLRHAGCTFCREALADVAAQRAKIESRGTRIVLVHMSTDAAAAAFFGKYKLADVARTGDLGRELYRAFELGRGSFWQLFGPKVFVRGFIAGIVNGHGVGALEGDGFQMPGAFLVQQGRIIAGKPHATAADRPDYAALACSI